MNLPHHTHLLQATPLASFTLWSQSLSPPTRVSDYTVLLGLLL